MPQGAVVTSVKQAKRIIKQMDLRGIEWGDEYHSAAREALSRVIQDRMERRIDRYLEEIAGRDEVEDRRNGSYSRHLLTELGDIELQVPRTRCYSAVEVVRAYARRSRSVDRTILACFVLGLSTRKVATALWPILGEPVSASTVSRVAKVLDEAVAAFHRRRIKQGYRVLVLDGVVLSRKTGAGAVRRPVLVALGVRADGKKEVIDFRLAHGESQVAWESFLTDLYRRGLDGKGVVLIATDGGAGLLAALATVFPNVPIQRCWAHKTRNVLDKVRKSDRKAVKRCLHRISNAKDIVAARSAARRFVQRWEGQYPEAVKCLRNDLDELLAFFVCKGPDWRKAARTTNAIERRFREVRRRTRPMGVFSDRTSVERILYAVFTHENLKEQTATPFLLTQNS